MSAVASAPVRRATWPVHSLICAGIAYIVATIFLLPYIEMIISAVRPADQMLELVPRIVELATG